MVGKKLKLIGARMLIVMTLFGEYCCSNFGDGVKSQEVLEAVAQSSEMRKRVEIF